MQSSITRHLPCPIQTQLQLQVELQKLKLKQKQEPFRPCRSRRDKQIKGGLSSFHLVGWRVSPLPSALSPFSNSVQYEPFLWPSLSWRFSSVVAFPFPCCCSCLRDLPCEIWTHIEVGQGFSSGCDFRFPAQPRSDERRLLHPFLDGAFNSCVCLWFIVAAPCRCQGKRSKTMESSLRCCCCLYCCCCWSQLPTAVVGLSAW